MDNILSKYILENISANKNSYEKDRENYNIKKFNETIQRAVKSNFYAEKLKGIKSIQKLDDIKKIPFTDERDIRENYKKMLCVPFDEVERIVHINTSGSTGKSKTIFFSKKDLEYTINFFSRGLSQLAAENDNMLILMPYKNENSVGDLIAKAVHKVGIIPVKYGPVENFEHALETLKISDSVIGDPVQIQALARYSKFKKIEKKLKGVLISSDFVLKETVKEIEETFRCRVYNHYGMTETAYGGAVECTYHSGMHPRENDLYLEIINPETNNHVKDGEYGEIVLTTFNREAMPLIRYKTGDSGRFLKNRCVCNPDLQCLDFINGRIQRTKNRFNIYKMDKLLFENKNIMDYKFELIDKKIKLSVITFSEEKINKAELKKVIRENFDTDNLSINIFILPADKVIYSKFHKGKRKIFEV
jgi:phenylacetate-CoA ligase